MRTSLSLFCLFLSFAYCQTSDQIRPVPDTPIGYYEGDPLPPKTAYLTFDDGPSDWTSDVLDVLKKENVRATFFVCAAWLPKTNRRENSFKKYRNTLIRMKEEGHIIGNHTFGHRNFEQMSRAKIENQLEENEKLYKKELGEYSGNLTWIRPPFGSPFIRTRSETSKKRVGEALQGKGLVFMWTKEFDSTDSKEWVRGEWYEKGPRIDPENQSFRRKMDRIYNSLVSKTEGQGIVILFHDTHPTTKEVLPFIIEKLKEEGYTFATAEDYTKWRWGKTSEELFEEGID
ncbi:polysaccharide deacetylase family protein [Leptospira sarikeiensis]|uniref:Polysaccharide deacetylase family protein n=1 Tax=Leptospira sarikeiensis TaxID=2484943 RepID=A0A4R9KH20_9LEPT|nr:polysaccharide deacetylase family protein [Leptospira sarikeiensis]TGL64707.1 polysaccharide deacetylase family protein [Leptospira sarikeiensis]